MRQFALTLLLVSLAMSAALSSAVADEPGKCEKTEVRAILKSEKPRGNETDFAAAIRRIDQRGGQFGFDGSGDLVSVDLASDRVSVGDADLACLSALPHLKRLKLSGSGITNAGVRQISSLAGLTESRCSTLKLTTPACNNSRG